MTDNFASVSFQKEHLMFYTAGYLDCCTEVFIAPKVIVHINLVAYQMNHEVWAFRLGAMSPELFHAVAEGRIE